VAAERDHCAAVLGPTLRRVALSDCTIRDLWTLTDDRGRLSVLEGAGVPFPIRRVFFITEVMAGGSRGGHAHRALHQFIICQTGRLRVDLDDGCTQRSLHLAPGQGVHVPPMLWAVERDFAAGTVYLVLASAPYDESDYFRDREEFLAAVQAR
jgi:hypothetical protein